MTGHDERLVSTRAADGVRLDGVVLRPVPGPEGERALVWVHGLTGSFHEPHALAIGRYLAGRGHVFVAGDNRGHDVGVHIGTTEGQPRLGGGWWELASESGLDVGAWIDFALSLGFARVVLIGHSYGAVKSLWYQAEKQDPRVEAIVSASGPPRVGRHHRANPELLAQAERLVAEGRGQELLPMGSMGGFGTTSAQTLADRARALPDVYGEDGGEDAPIARLRCPLLVLLGSEEPWLGTPQDLDAARDRARAAPRVDTAMVEGADHVYAGREDEVGRVIDEWVRSLP